MRALILVAALLMPGLAAAENAATIVLTYECAMASTEQDGFECLGMDGDLLKIAITDWSKVDAKRREHFRYRLHVFLLRYFDLGGVNFTLRSDTWPDGAYKYCSRPRDKQFIYSCWDR